MLTSQSSNPPSGDKNTKLKFKYLGQGSRMDTFLLIGEVFGRFQNILVGAKMPKTDKTLTYDKFDKMPKI